MRWIVIGLAVAGVWECNFTVAEADILCRVSTGANKGVLKVEPGPACAARELKVDPVALGLQGPPGKPGAPGPQGAQGPAGPAPNLDNVAIQWHDHGENCLYVEDDTGDVRAGTKTPTCSDTGRQRFDIKKR